MNILEAINDPQLFAPWFAQKGADKNAEKRGWGGENALPPQWLYWSTFLAALFGLQMTKEQHTAYTECTGRNIPPTEPQNEAWLIIGRRGGKSFILSLVAVFVACFKNYDEYLSKGERGVVLLLAADKRQAKILLGYIVGLLEGCPMLARMVERRTAECVDLNNNISIEVRVSNYRTVRGVSLVFAAMDELAFWRSDESASPDTEVLTALRPATATIPSSIIIGASSPYAKRGLLWDRFDRYFGEEDGPLIWHAPTRTMNPSIDQSIVDKALAEDPHHAGAEYLATFRTDVEAFLSREAINACIQDGVYERAPLRTFKYYAFCDPSGGVYDSYTLAIAHREGDTAILDAVREHKPKFSPEAVTEEFCDLLKRYRCTKVCGDRYGGEFPRELFRRFGINYQVSKENKSELYKPACLPSCRALWTFWTTPAWSTSSLPLSAS